MNGPDEPSVLADKLDGATKVSVECLKRVNLKCPSSNTPSGFIDLIQKRTCNTQKQTGLQSFQRYKLPFKQEPKQPTYLNLLLVIRVEELAYLEGKKHHAKIIRNPPLLPARSMLGRPINVFARTIIICNFNG
ncbi:hypothetical protein TNCV_2073761 [Trichonephila clavipes]|nr:hypothetical protein TNCV_2073761 [Trichonephila clavipes]